MFRNLGLITAVTAALLMSPRRSQAMDMVTAMVTDMDMVTTDTDTDMVTDMVTTDMDMVTDMAVGGAVIGTAMA
jgi:hypothetical protein